MKSHSGERRSKREENRVGKSIKELDVNTIKVLRLSLGREASGPAGP